MYGLIYTTHFRKDLKKIGKRNIQDLHLLENVVKTLENKGFEGISKKMRPHKLKGNHKDNWECHVKPDLLIIWLQIENPKVIKLIRVGSHSDLFK